VSAPDTAEPSQRGKQAPTATAAPDMVLVPDPMFQQLQGLVSPSGNVNPYWQQNLGMTTQVLPGVAGAQSFNAQQLTQTVPDFYVSTHRQ
jgi:hypothetical protein